jgi:hypothetical protein
VPSIALWALSLASLVLAAGCSNLVLGVRATQPRIEQRVQLRVTLEREQQRGAEPDCLVLPSASKASVDGVNLKLVDRGGLAKGGGRCKAARFELVGDVAPGPKAESVVRVELPSAGDAAAEVAEMRVAHLLTPRRPALAPRHAPAAATTQVRAGDPVTLTWAPETDRLFPAMSGLGLYFYWKADSFSGQLGAQRIRREGRAFHFTVPPMRAGPVKLRLEPGHPHPRVQVLECSVARCDGGPALPAQPIELRVLP